VTRRLAGDVPEDVIDALAGIAPGSALDTARNRRPQARIHAQASYDALFHPADPGGPTDPVGPAGSGGMEPVERFAVAAFIAGLHGDGAAQEFYGAGLVGSGAPPALFGAMAAASAGAAGHGPYGSYPAGPLTREDTPGPAYRAPGPHRSILGLRLVAALEHAHMLVLHPRDAAPAHLQSLLDAGWDTPGIITLSQLVAFLSYQIRVAAGLRVLAAMDARA